MSSTGLSGSQPLPDLPLCVRRKETCYFLLFRRPPLSPRNEAERGINPQISVYKLVLWPSFRRLFFLRQPPSCCCRHPAMCAPSCPSPTSPLSPTAPPPTPPSLLLISHLKSESVAVLTAQKEAVMCINPCMGSGCDKSPRRDTLPRKLKASSDSLVTLVTQRQQQTTRATTTVQLGPSGVWTGARVSHKHVGG